jgi:hypothetical protein
MPARAGDDDQALQESRLPPLELAVEDHPSSAGMRRSPRVTRRTSYAVSV